MDSAHVTDFLSLTWINQNFRNRYFWMQTHSVCSQAELLSSSWLGKESCRLKRHHETRHFVVDTAFWVIRVLDVSIHTRTPLLCEASALVRSFDVLAKPKKLSTIMVIRFRSKRKLSTFQSKLLRKIDGNAGASDNYLNKSYRLVQISL